MQFVAAPPFLDAFPQAGIEKYLEVRGTLAASFDGLKSNDDHVAAPPLPTDWIISAFTLAFIPLDAKDFLDLRARHACLDAGKIGGVDWIGSDLSPQRNCSDERGCQRS